MGQLRKDNEVDRFSSPGPEQCWSPEIGVGITPTVYGRLGCPEEEMIRGNCGEPI